MIQTSEGGSDVSIALPDEAVKHFQQTAKAVIARSMIVWGEHCTECAFPSCYSTCSFYTPRLDHHCRRFENGIERARPLQQPSLHLTRISFRRWGKLEATGKIGLHTQAWASSAERIDGSIGRLVADRVPAPLRDKLIWRLNAIKRRAGALGDALQPHDALLVEAWHDADRPMPLTISVMSAAHRSAGLFQAAALLEPGYNRMLFPISDIQKLVDLEEPITVQIEPLQEGTPPIVFGILDFCRFASGLDGWPVANHVAAPVPDELPKLKCVVWDLDNTLWKGTLVEDGIEGIELAQPAVDIVRELDRRGIINSIASKNDPELAFAALERFGIRHYFVFPKIGWGPKSEAVRSIIAEMDVGADTFAFIDDQPFERGEIQQLIPGITVFSHTQIAGLLEHPRCDVPVTPESSKRREMYQGEERRIIARDSAQIDYISFLRSCHIRLEIARLQPANQLRMYELSQRTNQLNFSGRRYTQREIEVLLNERPEDTYVLTCSDKFGEYGAIGFCVLMEGQPAVESFFMSCRVQRKRVENAFFQFLQRELLTRGADRFEIQYRPTKKNRASVEMLAELGFEHEIDPTGKEWFVRSLRSDFADNDVVALETEFPPRSMELAT